MASCARNWWSAVSPGVVMGGVELHPQNWAISAGKVTTYNLLQDVQHNPTNNKLPMPDVLSGGAPPPDPQNWARSAAKVTTWNLLQTFQHNPRNTEWPMPDVLSGGAPPSDAPKMATPKLSKEDQLGR